MSHYYTNQPETAHNRKQWEFPLKGKNFKFITDTNVFSKATVDFGSRVLIDAFSEEDIPEGAILDVGCGYGPIGLSLAYSTNRPVEMIDVNERAVALTTENAALNGISGVKAYVSNIYESVEKTDFAAVVSNPPIRAGKSVVHGIISGAYDHLVEGGTLTIVIQKKQGAPSAQKKMEDVFGNAEIVTKEKGYFIIVSQK